MPLNGNKSVRWPCGACKVSCKTDCIMCNVCGIWYHTACENLTDSQMVQLSDKEVTYRCSQCCQDGNESFDFDAAFSRLNKAARQAKLQNTLKPYKLAAISESISARNEENLSPV